MNKWEFRKAQQDLFGGVPTHSEKVKQGIASARASGVVWGRPRKQKPAEYPLTVSVMCSVPPYEPASKVSIRI